MPKVKIGEKVVAGDGGNGERKVFTNGHKTFDSFAARVLTETQLRERRTLETFELNKGTFMRPRNPIVGEPTPRTKVDAKGEVLERTGELLFPSKNREVPESISPLSSSRPTTTGSSRYNSRTSRSINFDVDSQPDGNPLKRTDERAERISSLQNMQDNLGGELEYLKAKLLEKQQRLRELDARTQRK